MFAQALVERGMLESIANGLVGAKNALEARIGYGNGKWLIAALVIGFLFLMLRPRR